MKEIESSDVECDLTANDIDPDLLVAYLRRRISIQRFHDVKEVEDEEGNTLFIENFRQYLASSSYRQPVQSKLIDTINKVEEEFIRQRDDQTKAITNDETANDLQIKDPDQLIIDEQLNVLSTSSDTTPNPSIDTPSNNKASEVPPFNVNDYVPKRQFRPRTLKQMKPYLVDRFEHQAQLNGDARRAMLIEKAAAEQNTDLLEQLQREDRMIREVRMHRALEMEKSKELNKKRRHIDNTLLGSDSSSESENTFSDDESRGDLLDQILGSSQSSLHEAIENFHTDEDIENKYESSDRSSKENSDMEEDLSDQLAALKGKLSKYQVLPKSYIRYLQNKDNKNTHKYGLHRTKQDQKPRKGLAVRKPIKKLASAMRQESMGFVNDEELETEIISNPYQEVHTDLDSFLNDFRDYKNLEERVSQSSGVDNNVENFSQESLIETGYEVLDNSLNQNFSNQNSDDFSVTSIPNDSLEILNDDEPLNPLGSFNWSSDGECLEDKHTRIDRMLNFGKGAATKRNNLSSLTKKPLNRSRSATYGFPRSNTGLSKSNSLKKLHSKAGTVPKNQKRVTSYNSIFTATGGSKPQHTPTGTHKKTLARTHSIETYKKTSSVAHPSGLPQHAIAHKSQSTNNEPSDNRKKRKAYIHKQDLDNFEWNRNPHAYTLQLEGTTLKFKKPKIRFSNQIFNQQQKNENDVYSISLYQQVYNSTPEAFKIYPLKGVKHPTNSLLNWLNISEHFELYSMFQKRDQSRRTASNETTSLLTYTKALEFFRTNEGDVDKLYLDLQSMTENMTLVNENEVPILANHVESFFQNGYNILSAQLIRKPDCFNKIVYLFLFFPILQLFILQKASTDFDRSRLKKLFSSCCKLYFNLLVNGWSPRLLYNVLVNVLDQYSTPMYDVLFIISHLTGSILSLIADSLMNNFKKITIETLLDYMLMFSNFSKPGVSDWKIIDFAVQHVTNSVYPSEYELYRDYKVIFRTVLSLLHDYGWVDTNSPFKALVKLLKKRKFVNFPNEDMSVKIFNKFRFRDLRKSDTLCNYFIKLVMSSFEKRKQDNTTPKEFSRLAQFVEPNASIFSDPTKPDVFLQTFINKINIYIMSSSISKVNYSNSVIKLVQSVIIQDDLACYEKAFEGLICYYDVQKESKSTSTKIFEELVPAIFQNFHKFVLDHPDRTVADVKVERQYMLLFSTIFESITSRLLQFNSIHLFLLTFGGPKLFQLPFCAYFKYTDVLMKILNKIIKSTNNVVSNTKLLGSLKEVGKSFKTLFWAPMMNLVKLADTEGSFIPPTNYYKELVCCIANISDLMVTLNSENWQSLNYSWSLYSIKRYHLVWLTELLRYNGRASMQYDSDYFIEHFAKSIVTYQSKEYTFRFCQQLLKSDYFNNEWLSFKSRFISPGNSFDMSSKHLDILSAFIYSVFRISTKDKTHEQKALEVLSFMIQEFKKEYESRKRMSRKENLGYYQFARRVLIFFNFPSGKHLLKQSQEFYYLKQAFRLASSITFNGPELQRKIEQILGSNDNFGIVSAKEQRKRDEEAILFVQEQFINSLTENKQDSFIQDLVICIINLQKDWVYENEDALDARDSRLYLIIAVITAQVNLLHKVKSSIWILLFHSLLALLQVISNSGPFYTVDYWLLFRFARQFDPLYGQQALEEHMFYKCGALYYLYTILNDVYHLLAGQEERQIFVDIIKDKWLLLKESPMDGNLEQAIERDRNPLDFLFSSLPQTSADHTKGIIGTDEYKSILEYSTIQMFEKIIVDHLKLVYIKNVQLVKSQNSEDSIANMKSAFQLVKMRFVSHFNVVLEKDAALDTSKNTIFLNDNDWHNVLYEEDDFVV